MKKNTLFLMALCLSLTFNPSISNAMAKDIISPSSLFSDSAKASNILIRLNEIKDMDKTNLSSSEKKALKKEVKSLKKEAKSGNQGVYLSVGAIIIIILLLILIL